MVGKGAGINATNNNGENALMRGAFGYELEVVEFLLEKGVDINAISMQKSQMVKLRFCRLLAPLMVRCRRLCDSCLRKRKAPTSTTKVVL